MIRLALIFFASLFLSACALIDPQHLLSRRIGNQAALNGAPLDAATREQAFDFVWHRIDEAYVDPDLHGLDWKKTGQDFRPKVLLASSDELFWKRLDDMVAELGDAHTRVLSPAQYLADEEKYAISLGLHIDLLRDEIVVMNVFPGSPAEKAGLEKGNQILEIDGISANLWWQNHLQTARKNSSFRAQTKSVKRLFNLGEPEHTNDPRSLKVLNNIGEERVLSVHRARLTYRNIFSASRHASGFAYVRLTGFEHSLARDLDDIFSSVKDAPGLVIDLRGNGGGSSAFAMALMNHLVPSKTPAGKRISRNGRVPQVFFGLFQSDQLTLELSGMKRAFAQPVVVLLDADSASASELTAGILQSIGRAKIVGQTSCGCLMAYFGYANVPGGGALAYSELDFRMPDGKRIEGVGVLPDSVVTFTREDLIEGRDPAIERALELLRQSRGE